MPPRSLEALLIGSSAPMQELRKQISQVAHTSATVLIWGESGTGKELVSRGVHESSGRYQQNFIPLNCGAIPKELFESELFGHEKGSFSGAFAQRVGRFEMADKGTLFLDEIGEMPLDMQVKMLRTLQEKTIERVGGGKSIQVDARIVAATNRCLETAVAVGHFREDLFYRLNVYPIVVPPLRERGDDVLQLFQHFAEKFALDDQAPITLADAAAEVLLARAWPGNVRELSNLVERLSIRYPGERIEADMLPPESLRKVQPLQCASIQPFQSSSPAALSSHPSLGYPHLHNANGSIWPEPPMANGFANGSTPQEHAALWASSAQPATPVLGGRNEAVAEAASLVRDGVVDLREHLRQIEVRFIESALEHNNGNVTLAAERLGLRRTTLIEKIKKHEIAYRAN